MASLAHPARQGEGDASGPAVFAHRRCRVRRSQRSWADRSLLDVSLPQLEAELSGKILEVVTGGEVGLAEDHGDRCVRSELFEHLDEQRFNEHGIHNPRIRNPLTHIILSEEMLSCS